MKPLRAVLAGCGGISRSWVRAAGRIPDVEICGLVDVKREAAEALAAQEGLAGAPVSDDLAGILDRVKPELVFNCTVPSAHEAVSISALAAGCHVLTEKPLADSLDGARRIVAAAATTGRRCAVIQNRRYDARIRRMKRFLDSGAIGRLGTVHGDFMIGAHFGGFRDNMEHVLLLDMAIHTFDAARYLIGADPKSVTCVEWNPHGSWYARDASAAAVFEMADGCVYAYRGSWCAEGLNTTWEGDWRFVGERGSATWDGADRYAAEIVAERGGFRSALAPAELPPASDADRGGGHEGVIREFAECVRNGGEPETAAADNIKSLAMTLGAIESAASGRKVEIRWT